MIIHYSPTLNLYAPRVEPYKDIADSLFLEVYEQAKKSILNALEVSRQAHDVKNQIKECNGIIAFTGDRGSGKTSAMLTIAGLLMESGSDWLGSSVHFEVLPTIDPSHLSKDETILDVVISRLYTQFNEIVNNREQINAGITFDKQRNLLKEFAKAHDAIRAHNQSHEKRMDIESSIENLTRLAAGNNMRGILYHLIEEYLRFKTDSNSTIPKFLVLCIDDLDLNLNMGYEICEEIRKFFNLPNVIVLFSAKLSQLTDLIKQRYLSDLEVLIREGSLSYHVEDMATKYIEKLIPVTRRCTMPRFNVQTISATHLLLNDKVKKEPVNYVDTILKLLFAKTGVILLKNRFGSHHFIPTNLRAMLHLLSLLDSMTSVELLTDDADPKVNTLKEQQKVMLKNNLLQLEIYLCEHNIRENLSSIYQQILFDMLEVSWEELNQRVARMIFDNKLARNSANDADGIIDICDPDTLPENVSIGDALYMLDKVVRQQSTLEANVFSAIAKMIYSMRLVQLTFLPGDGYKGLRQLLGGLIYNPQGVELVRGRRDFQADLQFDEIRIALLDLYENTATVDDLAAEFSDENGEQNIDASISSDYLPYYFWLELHTVSVGRSYAKADMPRWRRSDWFAPYYFQNDWLFAHSQKYLTISYLASITNSITHDAFNNKSDWAVAFNEWRKKHITAIAVFSADIITHVTSHLRIETEKQLKTRSPGSDNYGAVTRAVSKIIDAELLLLPPGTPLNAWMKNAAACPLWVDKRWGFHEGIDGIWYSEEERKAEHIGASLTNSDQNERIIQIRRLRNRCTNKLAGIEATQDVASLQTAVTRNISISGMTQLPSEIRKTALQVQGYIKSTRISLKDLDANSDIVGIKSSLLNEIQRLIAAIDNYHG